MWNFGESTNRVFKNFTNFVSAEEILNSLNLLYASSNVETLWFDSSSNIILRSFEYFWSSDKSFQKDILINEQEFFYNNSN